MRTEIRRLIDEELACGPMKTLAERLERALIDRVDAYCNTYASHYDSLGDAPVGRAIRSIQGGIIGVDPESLPERNPQGVA